MKQKIFSTDYLASLASSVEDNLSAYKKTVFKVDESQIITVPSGAEISDDTVSEIMKYADKKHDFEAAVALYEATKDINYLQASDPRYWTYLSHVTLWQYMRQRWNGERSASYIKDHWFLLSRAQQPLMRHALSGLWWAVKLSVVPDAEDKYRLTRLFFKDQDARARTFGTYRLGRLDQAIQGIFGYMADNPGQFENGFEDKQRFVAKYFNGVGGIRQLAFMDAEYYRAEMLKLKPKLEQLGAFKSEALKK